MSTKTVGPSATPPLSALYFGKDDAESDIARGGLLREGFLRTLAYEEALAGAKPLIIGRKGSGKSAIALTLQATLAEAQRVSLISPDEISAEEIRRFQLPGIPVDQSKQLIWRYVFAVQIAKYLLAVARSTEGRGDVASDVSILRRFLVDNGEVDDLSFIERFWKVVQRLKGSVSLQAFGAKIGADIEHSSPGVRANDQVDRIEAQLMLIANKFELAERSQQFHLLVDQIEKVWSNDRDSDAMVVGLLQAAKHTRQFGFVQCTVFLRTDIYEKLQFGDRDKFRGDEFHIDWDHKQLHNLILARAKASVGRDVASEALWGGIFPASIGDVPTWSFLVGRTLMRPRDIIQFCNACRDMARKNGADHISEQDVIAALALYSNWKLSDLQNEWVVNYPFLPDLFVLFANTSYVVPRQVLESRLSQIRGDLGTRYPGFASSFSADGVLSILYSIGLLGVVRDGKTTYYYQGPGERRLQVSDEQFTIHPCFRVALQSTSALALSPFEPANDGIVRAQFEREFRYGVAHEYPRAPRSSRVLEYTAVDIDRLRAALEKSTLMDDVRDELRTYILNIRRELQRAIDGEEGVASREVAARIHRSLSQLSMKLRSGGVAQDSELTYVCDDAVRTLERFLYMGELEEFA